MFQDHPNLQVQCNIAKRSCLFARHLLRAIAFTSRSCFSILNTSVQICQACNESMNICKVQCCAILCKSHVACHVIVAAWQSTQAEEMSSTGCWIISQEKQHLRSRCKSGVVSWYSCWTLWNSKKNSNDPGITKVIYAIYSTPQCFPPACSHLFLFSQAVTRALKPQGKDKVTKTEKITPNDFDFSKKLRQMTYRIWSHTWHVWHVCSNSHLLEEVNCLLPRAGFFTGTEGLERSWRSKVDRSCYDSKLHSYI